MCPLQNTHGAATKERHSQGGLGQTLKGETELFQQAERADAAPSVTAGHLSCLVCKGYCSAAKHSQRTVPRIVRQQIPQFNSELCWSVLPFAYFKFCYLVIAPGSLLQEQRRALGEAVILYSCFPPLRWFFVVTVASLVSPVIISSSSWRILGYLTSSGYSTWLMIQSIKGKKKKKKR